MDPFSALGLAGNICQFVDFSCKLISGAQEIYDSASGATTAVTDAVKITRTLHHLTSRLIVQPSSGHDNFSGSPGLADTHLSELALNCRHAADELLSVLASLHANSPRWRWASFRVAIETVMKKDKVEQLEERLEKYRRQIIMTLEVMQSEQQSTILWRMNGLYEANSRLRADMASQIGYLRQSVLESLGQIRDELSRQDMQTILGRQRAGAESFFQGAQKPPIDVTPHLADISRAAQMGTVISTSFRLLRSLRFNSMEFRYSKISPAHLRTFQWMFNTSFSRWLRSNDPIFWISGKPGSGKSTLMKFLVDNEAVSHQLSQADERFKVVTASYFFWINGTEMQKSQEGLLRSLLYDLLRQDPDHIYATFPEQIQMLESGYAEEDLPTWNREVLLAGFSRLFQSSLRSTRFCLFVDGLDEYEGEHEELILIVRRLIRSNVKLCIASRPWNVFESAFGRDQVHKLYLEHFNKGDITLYVRDRLQSRPDFQALRARESAADELVSEVIQRAQGVFLWVYLVVRSLTRGIENCDRISDLQRRLRAFPSDLDDFFNHILTSLDETYRVQAARIFQVALAAPRPLSLLNYWYVDMEETDPNFHNIPCESLNPDELRERQDEMWRRLNGRSKGLLEVTTLPNIQAPYNLRVDFLHRTVKDFLRTKNVQQQLMKWSSIQWLPRRDSALDRKSQDIPLEPFDPYRTLCKSSIAELRSAPVRYGYLRGTGPMVDLVSDAFFAVQQYEQKTGLTMGEMLNVLDATISKHIVDYPTQQPCYPWANWGSEDLITHAIKWNLLLYVQSRPLPKPLSTSEKSRLLRTALKGRFSRNGETTLGPDPAMVTTILNSGPAITLDDHDIGLAISALHGCNPQGLYGSLMLLVTRRALKIKSDSNTWELLTGLLEENEIILLKQTQKDTRRTSRNLRQWLRWSRR